MEAAPRRRTYNVPGHAHELTFCCYRRLKFLRAERTCRWLAEAIDSMRHDLDVDLWAYVFMPEHVHLIVRPNRTVHDMAAILSAIKEPVGRRAMAYLRVHSPAWIERLSHRRGNRVERHFWQRGGGCDRNVDEPSTLRAMIDYIHLNPVRRGLVGWASDWPWSSASWYEGRSPGPLTVDRIPPEWTTI